MAHGLLYVGKGNLSHRRTDGAEPAGFLEGLQHLAPRRSTTTMSPMRQWRHDDEEVAYPTFDLIQKLYQAEGHQARVQEHLRAQRARAGAE